MDDKRAQAIAQQAPDEPPMPAWWDEDDATETSMVAARQLNAR